MPSLTFLQRRTLRPPYLLSSARLRLPLLAFALSLVALAVVTVVHQHRTDPWLDTSSGPGAWIADLGPSEGWGSWMGGGGRGSKAMSESLPDPGKDVLQGTKRWDEDGYEVWNMPGASARLLSGLVWCRGVLTGDAIFRPSANR